MTGTFEMREMNQRNATITFLEPVAVSALATKKRLQDSLTFI